DQKDLQRFPRDLSWLSFNARVLQEAADPRVPLVERLRFLAIYSSNLDEFYRVRVAAARQLRRLRKKKRQKLGIQPKWLLKLIQTEVDRQQGTFGQIFSQALLPALESHGIRLLREDNLTAAQSDFLADYFAREIKPHLNTARLDGGQAHFLRDRQLYMVVELIEFGKSQLELVELPTAEVPRFIALPSAEGQHDVMFLDDVIRHNLPALFSGTKVKGAYAIKLSRDADLHIDDEFDGNLLEKIRKSLMKRDVGVPSRFLFDRAIPLFMLDQLRQVFLLEPEDLIRGGRYHNFHDFFGFPLPENAPAALQYPEAKPVPVPELDAAESLFDVVRKQDVLLHFPFQDYGYVLRFLEAAAEDPAVERIRITLYRVARDSGVAKALLRAHQNGKDVTVFLEAKARFDEASNLYWYDQMKEAGIRVVGSMPGIKVHAKLFQVLRREEGELRTYCYFGTGNFNEKSAKIYSDFA
ncbi:MAG: phospholipase D-like domain-containing protein, partial [Bacteroidota bacterium]